MSGLERIYRGRKYSKRSGAGEEVDVLMASLTIFAAGTPEAFYNDLSSSLLTNGLLPRFILLEYEGNITRPNLNATTEPAPATVDNLLKLFEQSYKKGKALTGALEQIIDVQPNYDAYKQIERFENLCIRRSHDANASGQPTAGLWSRAKEHVKQIACLIAIGVNPYMPVIEPSYVDIAVDIIRPSVEKICTKFSNGEVGIGDDRRQADIRKFLVKLYVGGSARYAKLPGLKTDLLNSGIIQVIVVRNYCRNLVSFSQHPLGSTRAFNDAWTDLIKYGELQRVELNKNVDSCVTLNMDIFNPLIKAQRAKDRAGN